MVRRLCICAVLLAAAIVMVSGEPAQSALRWRPSGTLIQHSDLSYGYIAGQGDKGGQWQVAWGNPRKWVLLVAANPQMANPDSLSPGDTLNVPPELVGDFTEAVGPAQQTTEPAPTESGTIPTTNQATATATHGLPWWFWVLMTLIAVFLVLSAVRAWNLRRTAYHNPYSGPPVRERGLPRPDDAVAHFTERYRSDRDSMSVAASRALPPTVRIEQIREVEIRGHLNIKYAGQPENEWSVRDVREWVPAWECRLSDGTLMYTLTRCANDVRSGSGLSALPDTQIRARQAAMVVAPQRQIWPEVVDPQPEREAPVEVPTEVLDYTDAKFTSPRRLVLHRSGREQIIDVTLLAGMLSVGVEDGQVYALVNGVRRVIGCIAEPDPNQPAVAEATDHTGDPAIRQKVDEIVAHAEAGASTST